MLCPFCRRCFGGERGRLTFLTQEHTVMYPIDSIKVCCTSGISYFCDPKALANSATTDSDTDSGRHPAATHGV